MLTPHKTIVSSDHHTSQPQQHRDKDQRKKLGKHLKLK